MVLDEFVCDANGTSHSALFGVTRGTFAFIVGQVAETGCLRIDTPVGSIRGRARDRRDRHAVAHRTNLLRYEGSPCRGIFLAAPIVGFLG